MRKRKSILFLFVIVLLFTGGYYVYKEIYQSMEIYSFQESETDVPNPFQGTYFQVYTGYAEQMYEIKKEHPDCRVILLAYNLDDEREMEVIPEKKIEDLYHSLEIAKELGLSIIFRAAYDFIGEYEEVEFSIMLGHIRQIGQVLNNSRDCIAGVQAGMIGAFGEWTQSKYMDSREYRMKVLEEWLSVLDKEIPVSVRRQKFIREAKEWGIAVDRLGVYNDGLFSSDSDLGTYAEDYDREADLAWSEKNIQVPFNGGEMPFVSEFSQVENVVREADMLNLSYLNQEYSHKVWELWHSQKYNNMPGDKYICRYLGQRLWVKEAEISKNFYKKKKIKIALTLKNNGFSLVDPQLRAWLCVKCDGKTIKSEAELVMLSKEEGIISGEIINDFYRDKPKKVYIGVQISRGEDILKGYCIRLANKEMEYQDECNWLLAEGEDRIE